MTARTTAGQRLQRLLAMIPWVAANDGPTVAEVCERFAIGEDQLLADLSLASMVGVHPYTPDELVEVVVEGDRVWVHYALAFRRPLRLTQEQALALVAASAALMALPGADPDGPLARGLAKVAASVGIEPDDYVEVNLGEAPAGLLDLLHEAVAARRSVELDYYAYGRDERSLRAVDPYAVVTDEGRWYVVGWCHQAGGERRFRVDRIAEARALDATFERPVGTTAGAQEGPYQPAPDDPRVTIELDPSGGWVVEQYPVESVKALEGDRQRVTLAVSARTFLERLLLQLGPAARVVDQAGGDADLGQAQAEAARRVLARYGATGPVPSAPP